MSRADQDDELVKIARRYASMLEKGPIGVFEVRLDGTIRFANTAVARLAGFDRPEEMIGANILQYYVDPRQREALLAEVARAGAVTAFPVTMRAVGGSLRHLLLSAVTDGEVLRGLSVDVTELHDKERELQGTLELNRRILEVIPGGVVHVGADGSITHANAEAQRVLGLSHDQLTQRYTSDFDTETLHEDGTHCPVEHYPVTLALVTGEPQPPHTIGVRRPDGEVSWAVFRASPVHDPETGKVTSAVVTFLDISERKQAEQQLHESEARYRDLVEGSPDPMAIVRGTTLEFINGVGALMLGTERAPDLFGRDVSEIMPDDVPRVAEYVRRRRAGESMANVEVTMLRVDGEQVHVELAAVPYQYRGAPATLFVGRDVSERKRTEGRVRALEEQVLHAQKLESLGLMASGVAHDFNNLLAAILGNASLARLQLGAGGDAAESLAAIEMAAQRAADLTRQMLTYAGQRSVELTAVSLSDAVREMADLLSTVVSKRATLGLELDEVPPIEGDPAQVHQIIMNLILNASDALEGVGAIHVRTGVRHMSPSDLSSTYLDDALPEADYVFLEVTDTGRGMDEHTKRRVFDPFFTTKATGRGLGLAAALGIVRGHKGAIEVVSTPGRGTTFRVYFPMSERPGELSQRFGNRSMPVGDGSTILVVDDESSVRDVTRRLLEECGYRVLTAEDGRSAIATFEARRDEIRVVLLDVTMGDMSGIEVLAELERIAPGSSVVLTSGYSAEDVSIQVSARPHVRFLQKPFTLEALLDSLARAKAARVAGS